MACGNAYGSKAGGSIGHGGGGSVTSAARAQRRGVGVAGGRRQHQPRE